MRPPLHPDLQAIFSRTASFEARVEHCGYVVGLLRRWRQFIKHGKHVLCVKENFLPRQTYEHVLLSCFSVVLKIVAHAVRKSEYSLALWLTGSNACEDAFSQLGGFGRVLAMVRDFSFDDALERLGHLAVLEVYKVTGEDPLRFGKHRGHKADIDMANHEDVTAAPADLTGAGHPADFMAVYSAAWRRGDVAAAATAERRGMKPTADARGKLPSWWEQPWEGDGDLSDLREADADEMGDEVLQHTVDQDGEPAGVPESIEPDVSHPSIATNLVDADVADELEAQLEEPSPAEAQAAPQSGDEELNLSEAPDPPSAPQLYRAEERPSAEDEHEDQEAAAPLDPRTAERLRSVVERALDARQASEQRNAAGTAAGAEAGTAAGRPARPRAKPTFTLPVEQGGGQVDSCQLEPWLRPCPKPEPEST